MDPLDDAMARARTALADGTLTKLVLAAPVPSSGGPVADGARRVVARPVVLSGGPRLMIVHRHADRDVTKNLPYDEGLALLGSLVPGTFRHLHVVTEGGTLQLEHGARGWRVSSGPPATPSAAPSGGHDRVKRRSFQVDGRWFDALDARGGDGKRRGRTDKQRQVDRFVEVLHHLLRDVPLESGPPSRWVDIGCGAGALTYATWAYLRSRAPAEVVGIELRPALAAKAEGIARALGCDGLTFVAGAAEAVGLGATEGGRFDGVIALHACDTATDDALAAGIAAGARWIVAAPCCHKELRPQLAPTGPLANTLRHGILRTREAEIATDAIRAALLAARGYDARVFEFVSTEHTDKNLMISAVRRDSGADSAAEDEVRALARFYGVRHQRLAERLGVALTTG